jgi:hypothetical protein
MLVGGALLALGGATGAAEAGTVSGTGSINDLGTVTLGDAPFNTTTGQLGIVDSYGNAGGSSYYDFLFRFTLSGGPAKVTVDVTGATQNGDFQDFHTVVYDQDPSNTDLSTFEGHTDPGNPGDQVYDGIDIIDTTGFLSGGSTSNGGNHTIVSLNSLSNGDYYIRLFGSFGSGVTFDGVAGHLILAAIPQVAETPIPAALPLFGSALAGLGFLARRRRGMAAATATA